MLNIADSTGLKQDPILSNGWFDIYLLCHLTCILEIFATEMPNIRVMLCIVFRVPYCFPFSRVKLNLLMVTISFFLKPSSFFGDTIVQTHTYLFGMNILILVLLGTLRTLHLGILSQGVCLYWCRFAASTVSSDLSRL